jgi:hypothetical protein
MIACFAFVLLFAGVVADVPTPSVCKQLDQPEVVFVNSSNVHCISTLLSAQVHTVHIDRVNSFDFTLLKGLSRLRTLVCRACGLRSFALLEFATSYLHTH